MITWRLWRALHLPAISHPLFERISASRSVVNAKFLWFTLGMVIVGILVLIPDVFLPLLLVSPLLYTLLNATMNGMNWAFNVSGTIALMRTQNAYEVLCLIPDGALPVNWIIYTGRLYHDEAFEKSRADMLGTLQLMGLVGFGIILGVLLMPTIELVETLSILLSFMTLVYIDYMQSVMTCGLLAIWVANMTNHVGDARLWAVTLFALIQLILYTILIVMVIVVIPAVHTRFLEETWLPIFLTPPLIVLAFYLLRELVISVLWTRLITMLNADRGTLDRLHLLARIPW